MPQRDLEAALQVALGHDTPFLPQLPSLDAAERLLPNALEGLPGLTFDAQGVCTLDLDAWVAGKDGFTLELEQSIASGDLSAFEPTASASRAFRPFLSHVAQRKLRFAKVQIAGPATARWVPKTTAGAALFENAELNEQIFRLIVARSLALVKAVRRAGAIPIVFLDEPALHALEPGPAHLHRELESLVMTLQREGALVGLHCCANTLWPEVLGLGFDVVSFDARLSLDAVLEDERALWRFIAGGGRVSLGIVPTDGKEPYNIEELVDSVEASLRSTLPRGTSFESVLNQTLLTPACGLGLFSEIDAARVATELGTAQRLLRAKI